MIRRPTALIRRLGLFVALHLIPADLCAVETRVSGEWTLYKVDGRDYVSVENILDFYQLESKSILAGSARTTSPAAKGLELMSEDQREVYLNGVRHWLCFPTIERGGKILISRVDLVKTIEPVLRPHEIRNLEDFNTVVIDAGHGGHDRGATGRFGNEKDFALDTARRLKLMCEAAGFKVIMTRNSDIFIPLEKRPAIANERDDSIFVSIHFNSSKGNVNATGVEVFAMTPRTAPSTIDRNLRPHHLLPEPGNQHDIGNISLATSIHHAIIGRTKMFDRGVKRARFVVLTHSKRPAVLVEGGFLNNPHQARKIATPAYRTELARAIASGIVSYRRLVRAGLPPKSLIDYRLEKPTTTISAAPKEDRSKPTLSITPETPPPEENP